MGKQDWNPESYLKYEKERTQPSIDLVSRISLPNPNHIIDIGCGPGNSTQVLVKRWPNAKITGIDNSPSMIEKAKRDYPNQDWQLVDAGKDPIKGKFDVVFANASIQWIPNHAGLLAKFYSLLSNAGVIAVQIPLFWEMPLGKSILKITRERQWKALTAGVSELFTFHAPSFYYEHLAKLCQVVEIWETHYYHVLDSPRAILEMIRSTGLRPYLDRLATNAEKADFEAEVLAQIGRNYSIQKNGKVLFAFRRLFFIAKKE